ncbi:MAG: hypothetical protein RJA22_1614 [Verrucomicrobiota bacterium]
MSRRVFSLEPGPGRPASLLPVRRLFHGLLWACLLGATPLRAAEGFPATPGVPGQATRKPDVTVNTLPPLGPGTPATSARSKPRLRRERDPRSLPPVSPSLQGDGPSTRPIYSDASPSSGDALSPAGFFPADSPPSPPPSASFQAVMDDGTTYNPDTSGAVGTNHLMTVVASAVQILNRAGTQLSLVSLASFWSNLGTNGNPVVYDPRVLYDPAAQRWVLAGTANPGLTNPGLLVAVSQSSDPTAGWHRYFLPTDLQTDVFPDSPNLGLSRDSVIISANMFDSTNYFHASADVFVLNKAALYAGTSTPPLLRFSRNDIGPPVNIPVPAVALDGPAATNYLVGNWNGDTTNGGYLAVYTLSTNANNVLELNLNSFSRELPVGTPRWDSYGLNDDNFAPQAGTTNRIYLGDSRIGNVVYRVSPDANTLFLAQTVFVPPGGQPTRAAVQWWEITLNGVVIQRGRIEDTATGRHFAYPSIAVNRRNDVLIGYSRFGPTQFPGANYSFRIDADLFSSLRGDSVLKAGEAKFHAPDDFGLTRWGDWSAAVVDPNDDTDLWTLQEYASSPVNAIDRWGTWWGRVSPPSDLSVLASDTPDPAVAGTDVTYAATVITTNNKIQRVTGVRLQATLPPTATLLSVTPSQGSCGTTNGIVTCDFGTVGDQGRATVSLLVRYLTNGSPSLSFSASANGPELTPLNNSASVTTTVLPAADLAVSATVAPDPVTVSNQVAYTLAVTNRGPNSATSLQLTNTLPPNTAFVAASPSQGTCSHNAGVVTCNLGTLPPLGVATIQITARPNAPGNLTNRTVAASASVDTLPANNTAIVSLLANAAPTLGFISDRTISEDTSLGPVNFSVGDFETPAGSLVLSGISSNPSIVPHANILFGGSGSNRNVTVTPLANANGTVAITRIVTDPLGASATNSFLLTILPVNDPPSLSAVAPITMAEDTTTNVSFSVNDSETPAAVLAVSGASSNPSLIPNASLVFGGVGASRTLTLTPAPNQHGTATISLTVSDGTNTASINFLVTVLDANDPPSVSGLTSRSVPEDGSTGPIPFTVGDIETPATSLSVTGFSANPTLVPGASLVFGGSGANRTLTVTPATNQFGTATILVVVTDTNSASATNAFDLSITPVNDPPTLTQPGDRSVNEDAGPVSVALLGITPGATNEIQAVFLTASSSNPSLIPAPTVSYSGGPTGLLTLTPAPNASGTAVLTVTAIDDGSSNNVTTRAFTVTVLPINDPPVVAGLLDRLTDEDATAGPYAFTVGDLESASTALTLTASSSDASLVPPANITFSGTGSNRFLTIVPAANATGSCRIFITVNDGQGTTTDSFLLTVRPVNDPPALAPLPSRTFDEDTTTNVTVALTDPESPASALTLAASSSNPSLLPPSGLQFAGAGSPRTLTLVPAADQFGSAVVTVIATDPEGGTNATSFAVTVLPVNDPPTLGPIPNVTTNEDAGPQVILLSGVGPGAANESQVLTFTVASGNPALIPNPTVSYTNGATTALLRFTPAPNAHGETTLTLTLDDGASSNRTVSQSLTVRILPVNDLPILAVPGPQTMAEDTTRDLALSVSDVESGAAVTLSVLSSNPELFSEAGLLLSGSGTNRTLSLRPLTNAFGSAEILVTATDADGGTTNAAFEVTVNPVNDSPSLSPISALVINEDTLSPALAFTIQDAETPATALQVSASSSNPTLIPQAGLTLSGAGANRSLRVLPATNQFGTASITVQVSDGALTATNIFLVTVQPVDDPPTLSSLSDLAVDEDSPAGPLAVTLGDVETPASALLLTVTSSDQALLPDARITVAGTGATRQLTLLPATNAHGSSLITVSVSDGQATTANSFLLTVRPVNDPPALAVPPSLQLDEDGPGLVLLDIGDVESGPDNLTLQVISSNPVLVPPSGLALAGTGSARTLTVTPAANQSGTAELRVFLADPDGATNAGSILLTVNAVNDAPTLDALANLGLQEDAGPQSVTLSGISPGAPNEAQSLTLTAQSSNPALIPTPVIGYTNGSSSGVLRFTPQPNAHGEATLTVTIQDGAASNNLVTRSFLVQVAPVNDPPVLAMPSSRSLDEDTTASLPAYVNDVEEPARLQLAVLSGNPTLFPPGSLSWEGTGTNRTLILHPATNRFGSAQLTCVLTDSDGVSVTNLLQVEVLAVNDVPFIDPIADLALDEDTASPAIPVTVTDPDNLGLFLTVTAASSNPVLIPPGALAVTGKPANRTLQFLPATNQSGTATITVTATDGLASSTRTFQVTVLPVNDPPFISDLPDRAINEDESTGPVAFTVQDADPDAVLSVSATCSNPLLVPAGGVTLGGSGPNRTIRILPATNAHGVCIITLTVSDGLATATDSFQLTVLPINDPPQLTVGPAITLPEDTSTNLVITVVDIESPASALSLAAGSSNPALLPAAGLVPTGNGTTRSLPVAPAPDGFGNAVITLLLTDPDGGTNTATVDLSVVSLNDPPTLDQPADVAVDEDAGPQTLLLTGITPGPANEIQSLVLSAISSAPAIIPNPTISYTNGGATAVLRFTPVPDAYGQASITVTVDDGGPTNRSLTRSLVIQVRPVNDLPTLGLPGPQRIPEDTSLSLNLLVNDVEGAALVALAAVSDNPALLGPSSLTLAGSGTNRTLTITPATNAFGSARITVTATDGGGGTTQGFVDLQVDPVNDRPTLTSFNALSLLEDIASGELPFAINDVETDPALLQVTISSLNPSLFSPVGLVLGGASANRSLRLFPTTNQSGLATLIVTVSDGQLAASNSFEVTVQAVNDLPTLILPGDSSIAEDTAAGPLSVAVGDIETPPGSLSVLASSSDPLLLPPSGILLGGSGASRTLLLTPAPHRSGTAMVSVVVTDADAGSVSNAFRLTVSPVNDAPSLNAISDVVTNEDAGPLFIGLSGISAGPLESQALSVTVTAQNPALFSATTVNYSSPASIGSIVLTPATNANGSSLVTVTVRDDGAGSNTFSRSFTVSLLPVNDPPTLSPLANLTLPEDAPAQVITLAGISAGPADELQPLAVTALSDNPGLIPHPAVNFTSPGPGGTLSFTPVANAFGTARITVTVSEPGGGLSVAQSFTVQVTNVNDAPGIVGPGPQSLPRSVATNLLFSVGDIDNDVTALTVAAASSNPTLFPAGSLVVSGTGSQRTLAAAPATNRSGTATIVLTVTDPAGGQASASFLFTVSPTGLPPALSPLSNRATAEDTPLTVAFTVSDFETPAANLAVTATSSNSSLLPPSSLTLGGSGANRTLTLLPRTNQAGTTLITLRVTDAEGQFATGSFLVTVTNVNDPPMLSGLPDLSLDEDAATGPLPFTVQDVETPATNLTVTAQSSNPTLLPPARLILGGTGANRTLTVTPAPDQSGTATVTLVIDDGEGGTGTRSFAVSVAPVNDPPTLDTPANISIPEDAGSQSVSLTGLSAGGGEAQPLSITATSSNLALLPHPQVSYTSPQASGSLLLNPAPNASGTSLVTVTVQDTGTSNQVLVRSFLVTVVPANDPPSLSSIADQRTAEDVAGTVSFTVQDAETPAAQLAVTAYASDPLLLPAGNILIHGSGTNRTAILQPAPDRFGTTTVNIAVSDGVASNVTSFAFGVFAVNDPPSLNPLTNALYNASPGIITLRLTGIGAGNAFESDSPFTLTTTNSFPAAFWQSAPVATYSGGTTGTLTFRPASNQTNSGVVAVLLNDGRSSNNITVRTFLLSVRSSANAQPWISGLSAQSLNEDATLGPLSFTVGDALTPAGELVVTVTSSNQAVIPNTGLVLGGSGSTRTLTITPTPNASGSSLLSLVVQDTAFAFTNLNVLVTVNPVNDPPTISPVGNLAATEDAAPAVVPFGVADLETSPAALVVTATSGNPTLVPSGNLALGGNGTNRALVITPAPNQSGSSLITLTVNDGTTTANTSFTFSVAPANDPPSLVAPGPVTLAEDASSGPLPVTLADPETAAGGLSLSAVSSHPTLLPNTNLVLGGSGGSRTLTLTPLPNQSGTATITLTVGDGTNSTTASFPVTVNPVNDAPTLNPIGPLSLPQDAPPTTVTLTGISAGEGESQLLVLAASSSLPSLIPHPAVSYTSPASSGTLTLSPVAGAHGTAQITVILSDGQPENSLVTRSFTVTINSAPGISPIADQLLSGSTPSTLVTFTVSDPESPAADLSVSTTSSNPVLIGSSHLVLGGAGAARTLQVSHAPGQSGFAVITVTARDPQGNTANTSFLVTVLPSATPPVLTIARAGNGILLRWPIEAGDYVLEAQSALLGPWAPVAIAPVPDNGQNTVTLPLTGSHQFFRLRLR